MNRVIFLDLDGVLNSDAHCQRANAELGLTSRQGFYDVFAPKGAEGYRELSVTAAVRLLERGRCEMLDALCRDVGASLVVVSSWRRFAGVKTFREVFRAAGLTAPVVGVVGGSRCGTISVRVRRWNG